MKYWIVIHFFTFTFFDYQIEKSFANFSHFFITFLFRTSTACSCVNHGAKSTSEPREVSFGNFSIWIIDPNAGKEKRKHYYKRQTIRVKEKQRLHMHLYINRSLTEHFTYLAKNKKTQHYICSTQSRKVIHSTIRASW